MFGFLLALLILDSIVLATVVLLQSGKGGGASTDTFLGGRQAVTVLTKMSWWCGGIFLGLSLALAGVSARGGAPSSILEGQLAPPVPVNAPPLPLNLDEQPPATGDPAPTTPVPQPEPGSENN